MPIHITAIRANAIYASLKSFLVCNPPVVWINETVLSLILNTDYATRSHIQIRALRCYWLTSSTPLFAFLIYNKLFLLIFIFFTYFIFFHNHMISLHLPSIRECMQAHTQVCILKTFYRRTGKYAAKPFKINISSN